MEEDRKRKKKKRYSYAPVVLKTAHIPHVNPEGCAYPLQHICADGLVPGHLPIGGFTDPRQMDDAAGTVSTPFHEEPESGTGDHACHLPLHVFYPAVDKSVNTL